MSSKLFKTVMASAAVAMAGFVSTGANAATANADATATILTPVTLTKTADINFGNIAANATGGNVVLTQAGAISNCGGMVCNGATSAATFDVGGAVGQTVNITVPASITLINGGDNMSLTLNAPASIVLAGSDSIGVGGSLAVAANQPAGVYTANFNVTANY